MNGLVCCTTVAGVVFTEIQCQIVDRVGGGDSFAGAHLRTAGKI